LQVFGDRKSALEHLKFKHSQDYEQLSARGEIERAEECDRKRLDQSPLERNISCLFCSLTFEAQQDLQDHVRAGHGSKPEVPARPEVTNFPPKPSDDGKVPVKRKRATLMDKISQLTSSAVANAASIENIFSNPDQDKDDKEKAAKPANAAVVAVSN
jgi:hypothetical protein